MIKQFDISYINTPATCNLYNYTQHLARSLPFITNPLTSLVSHTNIEQYTSRDILTCMPTQYSNNSFLNDNNIPRVLSESNCIISITFNDFISIYVEESSSKRFGFGDIIPYHHIMIVCNPDEICTNGTLLTQYVKLVKKKYPELWIGVYGIINSVGVYENLAVAGVDAVVIGVDDNSLSNISESTGIDCSLLELVQHCRKSKRELVFDTFIIAPQQSNSISEIIQLLYAGADYIMLADSLFNCIETASDKFIKHSDIYANDALMKLLVRNKVDLKKEREFIEINNKTANQIYNSSSINTINKVNIYAEHFHRLTHKQQKLHSVLDIDLLPELGVTSTFIINNTIDDFINRVSYCLRIAMANTGKDDLKSFKEDQTYNV